MRPNRKFLPLFALASVAILVAALIYSRYHAAGLSNPIVYEGTSYAATPVERGFTMYDPHRDFFKGLVAGKMMAKDLSEEDRRWVQKIVNHFDFSAGEMLSSPEELRAKGIKASGEAVPTPSLAPPGEFN